MRLPESITRTEVRAKVRTAAAFIIGLGPVLAIGTFVLFPLLVWSIGMLSHRVVSMDSFAIAWDYAPRTVGTATVSSALSVVFGGAAAVYNLYAPEKQRRIIQFCMVLPLLVGFVARNYAWLGLFSALTKVGPSVASLVSYTTMGVVVVMATVFVPFSYFVVLQGVDGIRVELLDAALTLGATPARVFTSVVLRIAGRAMWLAFALTTVLAMGYFVTPGMIGGGNHDFIGNGVLTILSRLSVQEASFVAFYLLLFTAAPLLPLVVYVARKRSQVMADQE